MRSDLPLLPGRPRCKTVRMQVDVLEGTNNGYEIGSASVSSKRDDHALDPVPEGSGLPSSSRPPTFAAAFAKLTQKDSGSGITTHMARASSDRMDCRHGRQPDSSEPSRVDPPASAPVLSCRLFCPHRPTWDVGVTRSAVVRGSPVHVRPPATGCSWCLDFGNFAPRN